MRPRGFTPSELLTVLVVLIVLGAVTVAMWRSHALRVRRADAIQALLALQSAQDRYFGEHAQYASQTQLGTKPPAGLGISRKSRLGFYEIKLRNSEDNLGYWATARVMARADQSPDTRCVEMRIDQNGRRFAAGSQGEDRSADCWHARD